MTYRICVALVAVTIIGLMPASAQNPEEYKGDPYTAGICPVSGEPLGSMGDPILYNHEGRDVRFCCAGCTPRFKADPAQYLAKVDAELIEQQLEYYPLDTDLVSGEPLSDDDAIDVVFYNRLVRFADQRSAQKFFQNPSEHLAKLDEAVIAAQEDSYPVEKCVVSGHGLDAMGEPIQKVYANRLVQFCCAGCVDKFWAEPTKYLSMLDECVVATGEGSDHKAPKEGSDSKKSEGSDHK